MNTAGADAVGARAMTIEHAEVIPLAVPLGRTFRGGAYAIDLPETPGSASRWTRRS